MSIRLERIIAKSLFIILLIKFTFVFSLRNPMMKKKKLFIKCERLAFKLCDTFVYTILDKYLHSWSSLKESR